MMKPRAVARMVPIPPPTLAEKAQRAAWGFLKETGVFLGLYLEAIFRIVLAISLMAFGAWFAVFIYGLLF